MACLAVITLIKDCNKILKSHGKHFFFFTLSGPTGSLNTKVLFKEYKLFAYVYVMARVELRLELSHSTLASNSGLMLSQVKNS